MASNDLTGVVVVVTGASSGIGRATALRFGARHAQVALIARRKQRLDEVAEEIERLGGTAFVFPADVSQGQQVKAAMLAVDDRWGRCDVLVNNAGYGVYGTIEECLPEDFERQMAVNYLGAVYMTKAALPIMRRNGSGRIINVSSISGRATSAYDATYCASKFALNAFTRVLRIELAGSGITASLISPGYTATEWDEAMVKRRSHSVRTPLRPMSADRVAKAIERCADRPKREVLLPRILKLPLLFQAMLPGLYERWQARFRRPDLRT